MSDLISPGRRIRHYRMLRGMTQKALGIAAGFSPETADIRIAQYESGARTPKHALLCTLAEALGVSSTALDIPRIKSREVLNQLLLALEDEYGLMITITENDERSICNRISEVNKGGTAGTGQARPCRRDRCVPCRDAENGGRPDRAVLSL